MTRQSLARSNKFRNALAQAEAILANSAATRGVGATMRVDDPNDKPDDKPDDDPDDLDDDPSGDDDPDDQDDEKDPKRSSRRVKELSDENARRRSQAKKYREERDELAAKLKEREDAEKSESERATAAAKESEDRATKAEAALQAERIKNAFLAANTISWHNSSRAFTMLDLSGVEIDDEGEVIGMKEAIAKLAKDEAYLVKSEKDGDEDDSPATGGNPGGKGNKGGKKVDRSALEAKFPALRGR